MPKDKNKKPVKSVYVKEVGKQEKDLGRFLNYTPRNEAEEKDLSLASLIHQAEDRLLDQNIKLSAAKHEVHEMELERQIHLAIMADKEADKDWKYRFSEDFYFGVEERPAEIADEIKYLEKYILSAKSLIKNEKYKNIPVDFWKTFHWDSEGVNIWDDDTKYDPDNLPF
ncbi:MAG: hypothetical protein NTY66_03590 [Candidatus Vogelbacteria bacterium]|nr:hypothetical protein [Candidatus Vogelbacteria bacterium]